MVDKRQKFEIFKPSLFISNELSLTFYIVWLYFLINSLEHVQYVAFKNPSVFLFFEFK